jgi:hypothetical protein
MGWAEIDPTKPTLLRGRSGWNRSSPPPKLIICRTWTVVHVLHATKMVAENGGWRRRDSLDEGVSTMIRRLSWWFGRHCWEERWPESFTGRRGRLLQKWEKGTNGGYFRYGGGRLVVRLATCGGAGGGEDGGGFGWWLERRKEREGEKKIVEMRGRGACF